MLLFWILASFMILATLLLVVPALMRHRPADEDTPDAANVALYRERLTELERERDRGEIETGRYSALREDLERGLLADVGSLEMPVSRGHPPSKWMTVTVAIVVPVCGIGFYLWLGSPHELDRHSMSVETTAGTEPTPSVETMAASLAARLADNPADAEGWLLLGRSQVALERYEAAIVAFEHAHSLLGDAPSVLTDWAEAEAAVAGNRFTTSARGRLERALELDPDYEKALWLDGFAAIQAGLPEAAIARWERLLAIQAPDSREATIVTELLAQVRGTAETASGAGPGASTPAAPTRPETDSTKANGARIVVEVSLAPGLAKDLDASEPVFVFAGEPSGSGPPVAVSRTIVGALPASIVLDESNAMVPSRSLANVEHVLVTARVARSGTATRTSGDMEGVFGPVTVAETARARIVISQIVP